MLEVTRIIRFMFRQRRRQHLLQWKTSEQIEQVELIFQGTTVLRKLLIEQLNRNVIKSFISFLYI